MNKKTKRRQTRRTKKGGLRFGRISRLGGTNEPKTKKLRFSEKSPSKIYYKLDEEDSASKRRPDEEEKRMRQTQQCIINVNKNPRTNKYTFLYPTASVFYPCQYRNTIFETREELKEYLDKKEEKLNSGKTTRQVYAEFRKTQPLALSKSKRKLEEEKEETKSLKRDREDEIPKNGFERTPIPHP